MQAFINPPEVPDRDHIEAVLKDYGFQHARGDIQRMYSEYVNNKLLGYAGGVIDQPDAYWQDMYTLKCLALWLQHFSAIPQYKPELSVFNRLRDGKDMIG